MVALPGEVVAVQSLAQALVVSVLLVYLLVSEELLVVLLVVTVVALVVYPLTSGLSALAQLEATCPPRLRRMVAQVSALKAQSTSVQACSNQKVAQ